MVIEISGVGETVEFSAGEPRKGKFFTTLATQSVAALALSRTLTRFRHSHVKNMGLLHVPQVIAFMRLIHIFFIRMLQCV